MPNYVDRPLSDLFRETCAETVADFCLEMYRRMGLLEGIDVARSSDPALRRRACEVSEFFVKPTPEISTFRDQLVHVAAIAQRFIDTAKGTKSESGHKAMTKAEVIALVKQTFQTGQEMLGSLTDAQLLEQVKFPFGDRMVTRFTFWLGPLYQFRNHHGQLVVYLRLNGIVPPTTARRPA